MLCKVILPLSASLKELNISVFDNIAVARGVKVAELVTQRSTTLPNSPFQILPSRGIDWLVSVKNNPELSGALIILQ